MIKYLEITNFMSINAEQVLDFTLGCDENTKFQAQPVIGFAGSNASGKTNTLRAISFMSWFMVHSLLKSNNNEDIELEYTLLIYF